ncbi:Phosphatidylinositol transfer protein (PITP) [Coniosporium apollinis]|uniref:Phosphatidylinositol transfer protein (PITP) n=1 Tax=Coniosporium apollinis TaxID=61459 RepID=A0ABQ9NUV7_9PEZI|nr:Phosphatidylinositol transfer protein (PITP) [Coniosporium apollinis]
MSTTIDPQRQNGDIATVLDEKLRLNDTTAPIASSSATSTASGFVTPAEQSSQIPSHIPSTEPMAVPTLPPTPAGLLRTPIPHPLPTCKPDPPAGHPPLSAEQSQKYADVLAAVQAWTTVPTTSGRSPKHEPLLDDERLWLTKECLLRYLRATKWVVPTAIQRLQQTLTWRREYGLYASLPNHTQAPEYISVENETGKQVVLGFDNDARPCLYLNPGKQNTAKSDRQLQHLVFMLERVVDLMPPGQETMALLINFKESSSGSNPSVGQGKATLAILQGHYPERLGRALISDLPWYVTTFFKLISPFIDPITKSKMKFNEPLDRHVPSSQLWSHYGGKADFEYDHALYWPALVKMCEERRAAQRARWESRGKVVGESEFYLRGGEEGAGVEHV